MHGMEAAGEQYGEWWIPNRHQLYSAQVVTQDLCPKRSSHSRMAGGAFISCPPPSGTGPPRARAADRKRYAGGARPGGKEKFLKLAWDAISSEFGSRHTQYEMFYAGAQFVTAGHSFD